MRRSPVGSRAPIGSGGGGAGGVSVATDVAALADHLAAIADVVVADEIGAAARDVVADAVRAWPVATGRSRAAIRFERVSIAGEVAYSIRGAAPYTDWIRQRGHAPPATATRLLRVPLAARARVAAQRIGERIEGGG